MTGNLSPWHIFLEQDLKVKSRLPLFGSRLAPTLKIAGGQTRVQSWSRLDRARLENQPLAKEWPFGFIPDNKTGALNLRQASSETFHVKVATDIDLSNR